MTTTATTSRTNRSLRLIAPALALVAAGALLTPSAQASGSEAATAAKAASATAKTPTRTVSTAEQRAIAKLDIASIVKTAKALPLPANVPAKAGTVVKSGAGTAVKVDGTLGRNGTNGVPRTPARGVTSLAGYDGSVWPLANTSNPNRQIGKLYFDTDPGPAYNWSWCTASVVNSDNKSLLLTAGHCVWNASSKQWYTNHWFYPGYQYGAPLGAWSARTMSTTWNYYLYGQSKEDMAAVVVNKNAYGQSIANVLGAHGISFNTSTSRFRYSFGYPVTDWRWPGYTSDGEDMRYCYGTDYYYSTGTWAGQMNLSCLMTGGASGGPWLHDIQSNWLGYANSVNSNKGGIGAAWRYVMFGPYFGNEELAVYNTLKAV